MTPELAWKYREGRVKRYLGERVGGTVVVHFIKKHMWFLETAAALLHGEDLTPLEGAVEDSHGHERKPEPSESSGGDDAKETVTEPERPPPTSAGTASESVSTDTTLTHTNTRTMVRRTRKDPDWANS